MASNQNLAQGYLQEAGPADFQLPDGGAQVTIEVDGDIVANQTLDEATGALKIDQDDGGVVIDFDPPDPNSPDSTGEFDENLAEVIDDRERDRICAELLDAIMMDEQSRSEWLESRAKGIELLGFKLEEPRGDSGASTAPVEGMSVVRHPLLQEACIRFQANAAAELLPAEGPVKVRNDSPPKPRGVIDTSPSPMTSPMMGHNGGPPLDDDDNGGMSGAPAAPNSPPNAGDTGGAAAPQYSDNELAEALEKDLNHYLTVIDKGYRTDTDRMLFWVGFGGCAFKKVYNDPIRRMPISRSVDAADLIVANSANDIDDAGRVTHRILMRKSTLVRMQLAGVYRKTMLIQPNEVPDAVELQIATTQGFASTPPRAEDHQYTIYECYVELDIKGFEHEDEDGAATGLAVPYKVTIDKDSRQILEIRRNWREDDKNCLAKKVFVKFPFNPTMGFYDIGLLQMLGNATRALTAAWRITLDNGMFANFPGFLYSEVAGRQQTNEFRVPPGGGVKIQTGGKPIDQVISALPYKDTGAGFVAFMSSVETTSQRVGGTAEMQVGEGRQDAPVGTTLALIEQATKVLAAVHIRLHAAQAEEFQLLKERFQEDPEAFWRHNKRPAVQWKKDQFIVALNTFDLVPAADPNTPSHMHRIMKAVAIKQLQAMNPTIYDGKAVDTLILNMLGVDNVDYLFAPPQPPMDPSMQAPPPDPTKIMALNLKAQQAAQQAQERAAGRQADMQKMQQQAATRGQELKIESADRAADRQSREQVAFAREQTERLKVQSESQHRMADRALSAQSQQADQAMQQHQAAQQANTQRMQHEADLAKQLAVKQAGFGGADLGQGGMSGNARVPLWPKPI